MEQLSAYNPFIGQHLLTHAEGITADRAYIAHYVIPVGKAVAAGAANVLALTVLDADDPTVIPAGTAITQPPTPRVLSVVSNDADATSVAVKIEGTDAAGVAISEDITVTGLTPALGTKAFATITKITLPAFAGAVAEAISVGLADAFGLPYRLPYNTVIKMFNGGADATVASATSSFDATNLSENYIDPSAALDPTKQVDVYLII